MIKEKYGDNIESCSINVNSECSSLPCPGCDFFCNDTPKGTKFPIHQLPYQALGIIKSSLLEKGYCISYNNDGFFHAVFNTPTDDIQVIFRIDTHDNNHELTLLLENSDSHQIVSEIFTKL